MIENYYIARQDRLMRDFDKTSKILEQVLAARYGAEGDSAAEFASMIRQEARREFEALIPQLPYIGGDKNRHTRSVIGTSYGLALYRAMTAHGKPVDEIGAVHYAFSGAVLDALPLASKAVFWLIRRLLSTRPGQSLYKAVLKRRARIVQERPIPGNVVGTYVEGEDGKFDCGVDIVECPIARFFHAQGAGEFAPYVCLYDFLVSKLWGNGLMRTMTLAEGGDRCDDRFRFGQEPLNLQRTQVK